MPERKDVRLGWKRDLKDHRDLIFRPKAVKVPAFMDLTQTYSVPVVQQGALGACTGNGIAGALAYLQVKEGDPLLYPSRLFIYYNERVIEGTVNEDAGAGIRDGIKSVTDIGFCPETDWPYDISKFTYKPSDTAYADASKDLVKSYQSVPVSSQSIMEAIALGYPVIFGITVYDSFMQSQTGDIPMPASYESVQGGHCMIAVGYDQATMRFKFQNSWGTSWGNQGFGTIPFDYLGSQTYGGDYWIVTADSIGPPGPNPIPVPDPTNKGCLSLFMPMIG